MPKSGATCKHEGCAKPADAGKGYCARHYAMWRAGKLAKPRYKTCRVQGCRKAIKARGRCEEHFARDYPGKRAPASEAPPAPAA